MNGYKTAEISTVNAPEIEHFDSRENWEEWSTCVDCTIGTIERLAEAYE